MLQGFLETIGLPYTEPGVWSNDGDEQGQSSSLPARRHSYCSLSIHQKERNIPFKSFALAMGGTCVVKPATEGSALGIYIVEGEEAIADAIERVFEIDELVVVEKYIQGTELTVAVLGNRDPFALPVIEIVPKADFYDFESKYAPGGSQHICPAPLDEEKTKQVMDAAVGAHKALQCSGVSRSDFILDENGIRGFWRPIPFGMTATSLLPDAARAAGISFPELCTKLIEYAFEEESKRLQPRGDQGHPSTVAG